MADRKNRAGLSFSTDLTYTFHFWQKWLDLSTFQLAVPSLLQPFMSCDAVHYLGDMPVQLLAHGQGGELMWSFCLRHISQMKA